MYSIDSQNYVTFPNGYEFPQKLLLDDPFFIQHLSEKKWMGKGTLQKLVTEVGNNLGKLDILIDRYNKIY